MFKKICQFLRTLWQRLFGHKASGASGLPQLSQPISPPAQLPVAKILELMSSAPPQYQLRKSLCTYSERIFYEALRESVGSEYLILVKVRMGDIVWLEPEKTLTGKEYLEHKFGVNTSIFYCATNGRLNRCWRLSLTTKVITSLIDARQTSLKTKLLH